EVGVVAFLADALHPHLVVFPGRAALADRGEQIPRQAVADVMGGTGRAEAAHVADRARRGGEVFDRQRTRGGFPVPGVAHRRVGDAMRRFLVDLPLRVIGADVAGVTGFGLARLLAAELVAQVAFLALADRAVGRGPADVVAGFAGEARDLRPLDVVE